MRSHYLKPTCADTEKRGNESSYRVAHFSFQSSDDARRWDDIQRLLVEIKTLGNPRQPAVDRALSRCKEVVGKCGRAAMRNCLTLDVREICIMCATGCCHFGSHDHRHKILTYLDDAALVAYMCNSHASLNQILGAPLRDLNSPNRDADAKVVATASVVDYIHGYIIEERVVRPRNDPFCLPRLQAGGYDTRAVPTYRLNRALLRTAFS